MNFLCEDVASNLPLIHEEHDARTDSHSVCVCVIYVLYGCVCVCVLEGAGILYES